MQQQLETVVALRGVEETDNDKVITRRLQDIIGCLVRIDQMIESELTFNRSVQHGIAAKMSYEYIVPRTNEEPSHFWAQNLEEQKNKVRRVRRLR